MREKTNSGKEKEKDEMHFSYVRFFSFLTPVSGILLIDQGIKLDQKLSIWVNFLLKL